MLALRSKIITQSMERRADSTSSRLPVPGQFRLEGDPMSHVIFINTNIVCFCRLLLPMLVVKF